MHVASFLGPLVPLPRRSPVRHITAKPGHASTIAMMTGGSPQANLLPFVMQTQEQTNWCWAATATSVSVFFDAASTWTQCGLASTCLGKLCCAAASPCDIQYVLDTPLQTTQNLQGAPFFGADARDRLQVQIDSGNPICCHIDWGGGRGHFVAIVGYDWNNDDLHVQDPGDGQQHTVPYDVFVSSYRNSGTWDYTYYTEPAP